MANLTHHSPQGRRPAGGFTLVEVLVSLVVLSIGLLGIAKLMLVSSHANDSAYLRSQATQLAYEMLDNMRANKSQAVLGAYTTQAGAMPPLPASCIAPASCLPAQLALYDVYAWKQRLAAPAGALPSGQGAIAVSATTPFTATIIVYWDDAAAQSVFAGGAAGAAAPMNVTLETVL